MSQSNQPIAIHIHVQQQSGKEMPEVFVSQNVYEDVDIISNGSEWYNKSNCYTDEMRKEALEFFKNHFFAHGMEACFSDYKGIELATLPKDMAAQYIKQIASALNQLPVPPNHVLECEDIVFATWDVPAERKFIPFSIEEFRQMWNNFFVTLSAIEISTPRHCEEPELYELDMSEEEQVFYYYQNIKPILVFDRMCGLQLGVNEKGKYKEKLIG
ncbi:hypothetical protein [Brevibacillus borstelensis]|uniref:hypothetical protein n=1 Tax=Brevibacillus TaxID=55080 RepID=UPI001561D2C3|nr:hypothetical protein [Brevibacillus borstelensis]MBE5393753.1 hypothetical protein [Brevibacillus borstelensis]